MKRTYVDIIADYYDELDDIRKEYRPHRIKNMDGNKPKRAEFSSKRKKYYRD